MYCIVFCPSQGEVTLTLADMRVTRRLHTHRSVEAELYSIHTVGLYIMISVHSRGLILIWDKNTRITIELDAFWRVSRGDKNVMVSL